MEKKSRVLIVGGKGYIGRRIVRASLAQGHPTFVLMRPEIGLAQRPRRPCRCRKAGRRGGLGHVRGAHPQPQSAAAAQARRGYQGGWECQVILVDEDDVATYTIKSIDDPRTLNKTIYIRPKDNILSQNEVIMKWETLSGKVLEKIHIPADEFLASMKDMDFAHQAAVGHFYHIFYEGCLTNFDIGEDGAEATLLYPEVEYTRMDEYMKQYL